jgi:hypothetical protein
MDWAKKINSLRFNLSYDDALRMGDELSRSIQRASSLFEDWEGLNEESLVEVLGVESSTEWRRIILHVRYQV